MKTFWNYADDGGDWRLELEQVDWIRHDEFVVPVWRLVGGQDGVAFYPGPFVREEDLPAEVDETFAEWLAGAPIPFQGAAYRHDFEHFLQAHRCFARTDGIAETIWRVAPVTEEPEIQLAAWSIREVHPVGTRHFVGRNLAGHGRVSSAIVTFDPVARRGKTASGRVYALVGDPGFDTDAEYVFRVWCAIPGQRTEEQRDVTYAVLHPH